MGSVDSVPDTKGDRRKRAKTSPGSGPSEVQSSSVRGVELPLLQIAAPLPVAPHKSRFFEIYMQSIAKKSISEKIDAACHYLDGENRASVTEEQVVRLLLETANVAEDCFAIVNAFSKRDEGRKGAIRVSA